MLRKDGDWMFYTIQCNHDRKGKWVYCTSDSFSEVEVCGVNEHLKIMWREWTACGRCWQDIGEHGFYNSHYAAVIGDKLRNKYPQHEFRIMKNTIKQESTIYLSEDKILSKEVKKDMEKEISILCTTCGHNGICKYEEEMGRLVSAAEEKTRELPEDSPLTLKSGCNRWVNKQLSSTPRF